MPHDRTTGRQPHYQRLAEQLKTSILTGRLVAGELLPSLRRQASQSGLGLNSVIRAYGELEAAGLIIAQPRTGYRVTPSDSSSLASSTGMTADTPSSSASVQTTLSVSDPAWQAMAHANDPSLTPLGAAHPTLDAPAVRRLYRLARRHLQQHAQHPSAYALPPGSQALRDAIATHLTHNHHLCDSHSLMLCQGAQQGMSLVLRQLRNQRGRCRIGVETPGYFGMLAALEAAGHEAVALATHAEQGLDVAALATMLEEKDSPPVLDAIIVMPDCQNPLGGQLSTADRQQLLSVAARHQLLVIENATFAELSFNTRLPWLADLKRRSISRQPMPSLITIGSLSKTLDPRTRCGWLWFTDRVDDKVDDEIGEHGHQHDDSSPLGMQSMIRARWAGGMGDMPWMHAALSELISSGDYGRHVHRMRRCYARRLAALQLHLRQTLGERVWLPQPSGGYLQWCGLPGLSTRQISHVHHHLLGAGIATLPGSLFNSQVAGLRLNAAQLSDHATREHLATQLLVALSQLPPDDVHAGAPTDD